VEEIRFREMNVRISATPNSDILETNKTFTTAIVKEKNTQKQIIT